MAGVGLPHAAIREQVRRGIDLVVHLERRPDGARRVTEIAEVVRAAGSDRRSPIVDPVRTVGGSALVGGAGGARRAGGAGGAAGEPAAARWLRMALEPLRRAGREGYAPSTLERRRLAALGAAAALLAGWFLAGASVALPLAVAGPGLAAWAISSRRRRYRSAIERALPDIALAVADSLTAGRSLRASLPAAATSLDGPPAAELARLGAELDLGAPTADAVEAWRRRMRSARVDAFAAALLSQQLAGGDLAGLLRRFAEGAAERDRVAEDAKSATAQARFTGLLVVAMPTGGSLFAELIQPGFLAKVLGAPVSAAACPRRGAAAGRLRRDPPLLEGGRVSPAGLLAAIAVLLGFAGARELLAGRGARLGGLAPGFGIRGRSATAALKLGLPNRLARSGLDSASRSPRSCWPSSPAPRPGGSLP